MSIPKTLERIENSSFLPSYMKKTKDEHKKDNINVISLLVIKPVSVYERAKYSFIWRGVALMSDGKQYSGMFLACGDKVYCDYNVMVDNNNNNNSIVIASASGHAIKTTGYPVVTQAAFVITPESCLKGLNPYPVSQQEYIGELRRYDRFNTVLHNPNSDLFLSPLFFIFGPEALTKLIVAADSLPPNHPLNKTWSRLDKCKTTMQNCCRDPEHLHSDVANVFHLAVADVMKTLFDVDRSLILQTDVSSLIKLLHKLYTEGFEAAFEPDLHIKFMEGIKREDIVTTYTPAPAATSSSISSLVDNPNIRYTEGQRTEMCLYVNMSYTRAYELNLLSKKTADLFYTVETDKEAANELLRHGDAFYPDKPSDNPSYRVSQHGSFAFVHGKPEFRISVGPLGANYCAASSIRTYCDSILKLPPINHTVKSKDRWRILMITHVLTQAYIKRQDFYMTKDAIIEECKKMKGWEDLAFEKNYIATLADKSSMTEISRNTTLNKFPLVSPTGASIKFSYTGSQVTNIIIPFTDYPEVVMLAKHFEKEDIFTNIIARLSTGITQVNAASASANTNMCVDRLFRKLKPDQVRAMRRFLHNRLTIVDGGPGTGKSYMMVVASYIMRQYLKNDKFTFLFLAFTNTAVNKTRNKILSPPNNLECGDLPYQNTADNCVFMTCDGFMTKKLTCGFDFVPTVIFIEESSQIGLTHMYHVLTATGRFAEHERQQMLIKTGNFKHWGKFTDHVNKLCIIGGSGQLQPLHAGMPFQQLITSPYMKRNVAVLFKSERLSGGGKIVLDIKLRAIKEGRWEDMLAEDLSYDTSIPITERAFYVDTSIKTPKNRSEEAYLLEFGLKLKEFYMMLNPTLDMRKYHTIMIACPVNDIRWFLNSIINVMQFERRWFTPEEYVLLCQVAGARMRNKQVENSEHDNNNNNNNNAKTNVPFIPACYPNIATTHNIIYKGMCVVFMQSFKDPDDPDRSYGKLERGVLVGFLEVNRSSDGADKTEKDYIESKIASSYLTDADVNNMIQNKKHMAALVEREAGASVAFTYLYSNQLNVMVDCGNVITAHSCQGEEENIVICCLPYNINMRKRSVLVTMSSRAREQCFIFGDKETVVETCKTMDRMPTSSIQMMLQIKTRGNTPAVKSEEDQDTDDDELDVGETVDNNNNNNNNNNIVVSDMKKRKKEVKPKHISIKRLKFNLEDGNDDVDE